MVGVTALIGCFGISILSGLILYFIVHLYFQKVQNPERKPGNNVLFFPGFVLSKVQEDNNIFNNIFDVRRTWSVLFVVFALFGVCQ
jgi:hypothetical protein